ncbi:efflux transporter, RND family, MFP subunit [Solidesulfovibrio carbinoliphilus subsp. oakridgensis]|uniref:Efflux transporter, RND family, MFP subunit n=1 Tax=Solidesulfovibrio carbinoliphilus subsp. oakridgensis TaxID=694327 RepID=G7QBW2_9BACT|nr:efflux RND transporter periplasmic adaptor subunit [Solidesulfovibrio carbinoliphilus]EHJ49455.1 efflux transporter, RND family, MFP subunit [Solidesulfovibrio carbinoliphilus subsp. oakridgensis]
MSDTLDALRIAGDDKAAPGAAGPRRRRRKRWPYVLALLAAAGVLAYALSPRSFVVEAATVSLAYPSRTVTQLTASGYIVAQRKASLATKATAQLVWLGVEEGSRVKKGDILARLESADVEAAQQQARHDLEAARYQIASAEAELVDARLHYARMKKLVAGDYVARSEHDAAKARQDKAEAALAEARANLSARASALRQAEAQRSYTDLEAPFDAVVLTKNADVGDIISPLGASSTSKAAVVTIADMASLAAEVDVSEASLHLVAAGEPCEILLDAIPSERFPGTVHMIVPTADRTKATVLVKVRFDSLDPRVLPEMSAKVAFLSRPLGDDERTPRVAVPGAAVVDRDGRTAVFVIKDGKAVLTPVTLGETLGDMRAVTSGVETGWRVVLSPPEKLRSGDAVTLAEG